MKSIEPGVERCELEEQELFLLSTKAWRRALESGEIDAIPLTHPEWIECWLDEYGQFEVAHLAAHQIRGKWWLVPLLKLHGQYYRVHFENVICEHCSLRCGPSATPDYVQYPSAVADSRFREIMQLPVECCPHCGGELHRRHTLWLHHA